MIHRTNLLIAMTMIITACSASDGNNTDPAGDSNNNGTATVLQGTWIKSCGIGDGEDPFDPHAFYDIVTVTFTLNNFTSSIENFSNASCTTPFAPAPNPTASGTFTVGGTLTTTGGQIASQTDSHLDQFNGAPFDIDEYDIFYISGISLFLGDTSGSNDGLLPSSRPDTLDFDREFVRQ